MRFVRWLLVAGLLAVLVGGTTVWRELARSRVPAGELPSVIEHPDAPPLPAFRLAGPRGAFTERHLAGRWSLLFFGYTHCPDVCPGTLSLLRELLAAVPSAPTFQAVFVSVDPARDSHLLLQDYLAAFGPAFIGVTGDDAALAPLRQQLGVFYQRHDANEPRNYSVDHSASLYLIDPRGRLAASFPPPQNLDRMTADLRRITLQP